MRKNDKIRQCIFALSVIFCLLLTGCTGLSDQNIAGGANTIDTVGTAGTSSATLDALPAYSGNAYVTLNDNQPEFDEKDLTTDSFETYSDLDDLGRCGTAYANIGQDLMPTEKRGNISPIKPSGWQSVKYDFVEGKYLYNRCHLIGFQLSGENANKRNLITGTRSLNVEGMLPFENEVADYVQTTGNHVLYRVTPIFEGDNLVASGVQMEAQSVEDDGEGICFNIYAYNTQPGIEIDYATGESHLDENADLTAPERKDSADTVKKAADADKTVSYVLNTNTHKYHLPSCSSVADTKAKNRKSYTGSKAELESQGYEPCGRCKP